MLCDAQDNTSGFRSQRSKSLPRGRPAGREKTTVGAPLKTSVVCSHWFPWSLRRCRICCPDLHPRLWCYPNYSDAATLSPSRTPSDRCSVPLEVYLRKSAGLAGVNIQYYYLIAISQGRDPTSIRVPGKAVTPRVNSRKLLRFCLPNPHTAVITARCQKSAVRAPLDAVNPALMPSQRQYVRANFSVPHFHESRHGLLMRVVNSWYSSQLR